VSGMNMTGVGDRPCHRQPGSPTAPDSRSGMGDSEVLRGRREPPQRLGPPRATRPAGRFNVPMTTVPPESAAPGRALRGIP
jgi:hypothetical protein